MSYQEYLNSEEWKSIRRKASKRSFYDVCWICGSAEKLELHHKNYKWLGTAHAMRNLVRLCRTHHQAIHDYAKRQKISVSKATRKYRKLYIKRASEPENLTLW